MLDSRASVPPPSVEPRDARDDRLLQGIRVGAPEALEEAFHVFYDALYRYAYRFVRSREAAEELIQDVFLRVWERRCELHGGERLGPYLFAAVRNAAISWLRRSRLERTFQGNVMEARDPHARAEPRIGVAIPGMSQAAHEYAAAEGRWEDRELAEELHRAIEKLPTRARQAITLRWQRQLKNAEIAKVMGCSVKAVEFSIARALDALRRILAAP